VGLKYENKLMEVHQTRRRSLSLP